MTEALQYTPLEDMPLHEITQRFGENGLLNWFHSEIDALSLDINTRILIDDALQLMLRAHKPQKPRGDLPYSTHVLRVATRLITHLEVSDPEIVIAALLHDTVEDQPGGLIGIVEDAENPRYRTRAMAMIEERFGTRVRNLVAAVTNPEFNDEEDRQEQYREHVVTTLRLAENASARVIKLSDFIDNAGGIGYNESPEHALKLAKKYLPLIPHMIDFALADNTPLTAQGRAYIYNQLVRTEPRLRAIVNEARKT